MITTARIILFSSAALFCFTITFFMVKISRAKKALPEEKAELKKSSLSYKLTHVAAALLALSPLFFLFKPYIQIAICLCGIIGEYTVCKERLKVLTQ